MDAGLYNSAAAVYCTSAGSDLGFSGNDSDSVTIYRDISVYFRVYAYEHLRFDVKMHKDYSVGFF
jgi:hypothetical protein